ncbi:MAG TPA: DUF305 domain-containing protein [Gemmatimonadaceae bacterium]|nr:DUF305 domain-containing protein [Gemmatimonadaceae bacterium]
MRNSSLTALVAAVALVGCSTTTPAPEPTPAPASVSPPIAVVDQATLNPAAQARADGGKPPFVEADVKFMQGMIHHHAQAILIAKWAPSHGAGAALQRLAERIVVAQRDEIDLMRTWLAERKLEVPVADTLGKANEHAGHDMPGMAGPVMMPGMLTPQQVAQLDSARGREFDRLFLRYMIRHHEGAIEMVQQLFRSHGAAQDGVVYRFAADVEADQGAEIERMTLMLNAIPPGGSPLSPRNQQ